MMALTSLLEGHRIIVCAGAGGVGKTTVSAALAIAAARRGRRVLVLTIDPSRRLAQTLGINPNLPDPVPLGRDFLEAAGISRPELLWGWVLVPGRIAERAVGRLAASPQEAQRLMANPIYRGVSSMVAGMQEYTAVEALHSLTGEGRFDLVVLDTPPSRNALSFLDAPVRLGKFLDGRIFNLFLPDADGLLAGAARKVTRMVLGRALGEESYRDFTLFLSSFSSIFKALGANAAQMKQRLQEPGSTFLMVTSASQAALHDALHFRKRLERLELPCGGFVLNRTRLPDHHCPMPAPGGGADDPVLAQAIAKLMVVARREQAEADGEAAIARQLRLTAGELAITLVLPELADGVDDARGLARLGEWLEQADQS